MNDIFLSYYLDDLDDADRLRTAFRQKGWTVWENPYSLHPDVDTEVSDREIKDAKVIVILWSHAANNSHLRGMSPYLRGVLTRQKKVLIVPVLLERIVLPPYLDRLKRFDLSDWGGEPEHAGLTSLLRHLRILIISSSATALPNTQSSSPDAGATVYSWLGLPPDSRSGGDTRSKGVFISYRRDEASAYAGRLYDRLAARFGRERVFFDVENVGWGEDFVEAITAAAESCAVMIALISREWSRGAGEEEGAEDYVRLEVAKALGRRIRVIPILIQGASMPKQQELPEDLAPLLRRNALSISDARWERDVEDLIKALEGVLKV